MVPHIVELLVEKKLQVDSTTLAMAVSACGHLRDSKSANQYWRSFVEQLGVVPDNPCFAAMIVACSRAKDAVSVRRTYRSWTESSAVTESQAADTWSVIILALGDGHLGLITSSLESKFRGMLREGSTALRSQIDDVFGRVG